MKQNKILQTIAALALLVTASACEHIDNKTLPNYTVRIDLSGYALWNTYGVSGMGDYRIFNREKGIPSNFPYNVNTYTGFGGVLVMMGIDGPMAYDLACPVEVSPDVTLSISADNFDAVCPRCNSHFDPLMNAGGHPRHTPEPRQHGQDFFENVPRLRSVFSQLFGAINPFFNKTCLTGCILQFRGHFHIA